MYHYDVDMLLTEIYDWVDPMLINQPIQVCDVYKSSIYKRTHDTQIKQYKNRNHIQIYSQDTTHQRQHNKKTATTNKQRPTDQCSI